jgi:hypothetical protein
VESHAIQKISLYAIAVSPRSCEAGSWLLLSPLVQNPLCQRNSDAVAGLRAIDCWI